MSALLFVDDETSVLRSYKRTFRKREHQLFFAEDGFEALTILSENEIDVMLDSINL